MYPTTTADGRTMVFLSTDRERPGLWKTTDGGRPVQVIPGQAAWPCVTRDDRHVVFASSQAGVQSLWMVSIDGGTPIQVANRFAAAPTLSPDGKAIFFGSLDNQERRVFLICDLSDCSSPQSVPFPAGAVLGRWKWTPDGQGIAYVTGMPPNIWVQSVNGKPARQFTHFTDDREIADLAWSRDGTRLAIARAMTTNDIVLFKGLRK
jgi:Tol biopolymer transport system component